MIEYLMIGLLIFISVTAVIAIRYIVALKRTKPIEDSLSAERKAELQQAMKASERNVKSSNQILHELLQSIGTTIDEEEETEDKLWKVSLYKYQGGTFRAFSTDQNDEFFLQYPYFLDVPYTKENLDKVLNVCRIRTAEKRHVKVVHHYEAEKNTLCLSVIAECLGPSVDALKYIMALMFDIAHVVREDLSNPEQIDEEERCIRMRNRELFYRCLQMTETLPEQATYSKFNGQHLTVEQAIDTLFSKEQLEDMLSLTILTEHGTEQITQSDQISSLNLFSTMVTEADNGLQVSQVPAVITLDTTFNHYTFTLHLTEQTNDCIFLRLSAMKVFYDHLQNVVPESVYKPESVSCIVCYEINEASSTAAFEQLIQDAKTAQEAGGELTEEQAAVLSMRDTSLSQQFAVGQRFYTQGGYMQALSVLLPVFQCLHDDKKEIHKDPIVNVASLIGRCYFELRMWDRAIYYLNIAHNSGHLTAKYYYFQALYQMNYIYILSELNVEISSTESILQQLIDGENFGMEDKQEQHAIYEAFILFLIKMRVLHAIRLGMEDCALSDLCYLLQYDSTRDFAQEKIDEIEKNNTGID